MVEPCDLATSQARQAYGGPGVVRVILAQCSALVLQHIPICHGLVILGSIRRTSYVFGVPWAAECNTVECQAAADVLKGQTDIGGAESLPTMGAALEMRGAIDPEDFKTCLRMLRAVDLDFMPANTTHLHKTHGRLSLLGGHNVCTDIPAVTGDVCLPFSGASRSTSIVTYVYRV